MTKALEAIKDGKMSINKAAKTYRVPCTTLKDRVSGRVIHGSLPGPSRYFDEDEEKTLSEHLVQAARVGYGKTRKQVLSIVENVAREKDVLRSGSTRVSDGWWRRFMQRQPELSLRRGDPTAHVRMDATNREAIAYYYNLLEETLKKIRGPAQCYNMEPESSEKILRLDDVIISDRCCVCYQDYSEGEGVEWVQCPCTRWLHEDCVVDSVMDSSGKELLCPHCCV